MTSVGPARASPQRRDLTAGWKIAFHFTAFLCKMPTLRALFYFRFYSILTHVTIGAKPFKLCPVGCREIFVNLFTFMVTFMVT